jgi:hypothetical protein
MLSQSLLYSRGGLIAGLNFSLYKGFRMVSREGPWPCWLKKEGAIKKGGGCFFFEGVSFTKKINFLPFAVGNHPIKGGGSQ